MFHQRVILVRLAVEGGDLDFTLDTKEHVCLTVMTNMQHVKKHNPPCPSFTHALIHYLKGEELALSSRVTPVADAGLVGDSGSDGPPRHRADIDSIDLALEVSVENLTESLCRQWLGGISKLQLKSAIRIHTNPRTGQIAANIL